MCVWLLESKFESSARVGSTRPGLMGPGFDGCWRRTVTSGRSEGRDRARRPQGEKGFVSDVYRVGSAVL
jgi:hypothetical protein